MLSGLRFSARDSDEIGFCGFCCRQLYFYGMEFCGRACENRKRQLTWKTSAELGTLPLVCLKFNEH